jgi:hypothetical protein
LGEFYFTGTKVILRVAERFPETIVISNDQGLENFFGGKEYTRFAPHFDGFSIEELESTKVH